MPEIAAAFKKPVSVELKIPDQSPPEAISQPRKWNTKNLGLRLGSDVAGAASAAVLVAPLITIIDR